jgi:hypothetical protein
MTCQRLDINLERMPEQRKSFPGMIWVVPQNHLWSRVQDVIGMKRQTGRLNVQWQGTMLGYRWNEFIWICWASCPNWLQITPIFWLWWTSLRNGWKKDYNYN